MLARVITVPPVTAERPALYQAEMAHTLTPICSAHISPMSNSLARCPDSGHALFMSASKQDKRTEKHFHTMFCGPDSGRKRIHASVFAQEYIRNGGDYDAAERFATEYCASNLVAS